MDNLETQATMGTQNTGQINVRQNQRGNKEWTIQGNWQHWVHKTQGIDTQKHSTETIVYQQRYDPSNNFHTGTHKAIISGIQIY